MKRTGSGAIGFYLSSGMLLVIAVVALALLALGGWMLLRR